VPVDLWQRNPINENIWHKDFSRGNSLASAILLLAVAPSSDARDGATPEVRFVAALRLPELPRLPGLGAPSADRNTCRNIYDLKKLAADIEYNGNAGGKILQNCLSRLTFESPVPDC
jgi:hypothetical protein